MFRSASATSRSFQTLDATYFIWAVVAASVIVFFLSHSSFSAWLHEAFNVTWRLALLVGLLSLPAANAYRRQKDPDGSYHLMRLAAMAFLAALVMLRL
jgi:hypothetical protein